MIAASAARFDPDVEAAMLAVYGIDTLAPGLTPRRLKVLLDRLPPGAAPTLESPMAWSAEAHLLASVLDAIRELTWVQVAKASKRRPKPPRPTQRPGPRRKIRVSARDLADALSGVEGVQER